jgi:hypothetical protein
MALTLVLLGICAVWSARASALDGALLTIGVVWLDGVLMTLAVWLGSEPGDDHEALP